MDEKQIKDVYIKQACNDFTFWTITTFTFMCGFGLYLFFGFSASCSLDYSSLNIGNCSIVDLKDKIYGSLLIIGGLPVLFISVSRLRNLFVDYKSLIGQQGN